MLSHPRPSDPHHINKSGSLSKSPCSLNVSQLTGGTKICQKVVVIHFCFLVSCDLHVSLSITNDPSTCRKKQSYFIWQVGIDSTRQRKEWCIYMAGSLQLPIRNSPWRVHVDPTAYMDQTVMHFSFMARSITADIEGLEELIRESYGFVFSNCIGLASSSCDSGRSSHQ